MNIKRQLKLTNLLKNRSYFLFGPRATGKTYMINQQVKSALVINLLKSSVYLHLSARPDDLEKLIDQSPDKSIVVIDEIQRVPELLNEVHRLIEERQLRFLLTGSSARKLRRGGANLLAGRAREARLFPLTSAELGKNFDLLKYLQYGGLPLVYFSDEPEDDLYAYVDTYLKQEIQAEAVVRKIPAFIRFLKISALTSGQMINFSNIANDAGVSSVTVAEYYDVLEDTFIGFVLPAYTKTVKRKAIATAKFYYFDIGVKSALAETLTIPENGSQFGEAFEHFIALELRAYLSYRRKRLNLAYWQSVNRQEVDFIVGDQLAIEVKSTQKVQDKHLRGLKAFAEEDICQKYFLVSRDEVNRKIGDIQVLYWKDFLEKLWNDELLE